MFKRYPLVKSIYIIIGCFNFYLLNVFLKWMNVRESEKTKLTALCLLPISSQKTKKKFWMNLIN